MLLALIFSFYYANAASPFVIKKEAIASTLKISYSVCTCSHTFNYGGYTFEYFVAYESTNGCDPCFAIDSYAGLFSGGRLLEEGVPTESGVGFACGVNMSYCPN